MIRLNPSRRGAVSRLPGLACLALAVACGSPVTADGPRVARLELSHAAFELAMGETRTVVARAYDADGKEVAAGVFWSSQQAAVATVSQQGLVTAVALGATQIAASAGGVSAVASVTVTERPVARIRVTPSSADVIAGTTLPLTAEAVDALGVVVEGRTFTWLTSSAAVATVSNQGVVTGISPGSATIHAVSAGTEGSAVVRVLPAPVASIDLQPENFQVDAGATLALTATPLDATGKPLTGRALSWSSSNPGVATVSQAGVVSGVAPGSASIQVSAPGAGADGSTPTRSTNVTVLLPAVARVVINPGGPSVTVGSVVDFSVSLFGTNDTPLATTHRAISWSSSSPAVASIDPSTGRATAAATGATNITATVITPGRPGSQSGTTTMTVGTVPVANVTVTPGTAAVHAGAAYARTFTAVLRSAQGTILAGRAVSWSSTDPAVATVDPVSGQVTGLVPGMTRINATSEGVTGGADVTVDLVDVSSVFVTPGTPSLAPLRTVQLQAEPRDSSGAPIAGVALGGRITTWASSATAVATVDGAGLVTAVSAGTAQVTATIGGTPGSATVTVIAPAVASVTVTAPADSVIGTDTLQLSAELRDAANTVITGQPVAWASGNAAVASVDPVSGLVTGVSPGTATITATSSGVSGTFDVRVLAPVATVTVTPGSATVTHPATLQATVALADANGATLAGRPVAWSALDPAVATVDPSGLVTTAAAGTARIVASSEGRADTLSLTVAAPVVAISPGHRNIALLGTGAFLATVSDHTAAPLVGMSCDVSSSNVLVAVVTPAGPATTDGSGQIALSVTGILLGNATITVTCGIGTGTATVTVR